MMKSAVVISIITAIALGLPTPDPREISLGIPAVVVDGHPIKVPKEKRDLANSIGVNSKFSIGDHTISAGGGAVSVGGHAVGGSVGKDPGSSITIHTRGLEPNIPVMSELPNIHLKRRGITFISGAPAIGIGTSAVGGSVCVSEDSQGKAVRGKDCSGIANGGKGGDALVPGSKAGNGGNGGIIINSVK